MDKKDGGAANEWLLNPENGYVKQYVAERFQLRVSKILPAREIRCMTNAEVRVRIDRMLDGLIIEVRDWILAGEHPVKRNFITRQTPLNSYEHFKKQFFPRWLLRKCPIQYETETIGIRRDGPIYVCPHMDEKWGHSEHLTFLSHSMLSEGSK